MSNKNKPATLPAPVVVNPLEEALFRATYRVNYAEREMDTVRKEIRARLTSLRSSIDGLVDDIDQIKPSAELEHPRNDTCMLQSNGVIQGQGLTIDLLCARLAQLSYEVEHAREVRAKIQEAWDAAQPKNGE